MGDNGELSHASFYDMIYQYVDKARKNKADRHKSRTRNSISHWIGRLVGWSVDLLVPLDFFCILKYIQ